MTKRLLLGLSLSLTAAMSACLGSSIVLEDTPSSSGTSSSASSSGTSSRSSSGTGGGSTSTSAGTGGGSASSTTGTGGASTASTTGTGGASTASTTGSGGGSTSSTTGSGGQGGTTNDGGITTVYFTDFEGPCPDGWTLSGDWQCGTPSNVAPSSPSTTFSGTQCIATQIANNYSDNDAWAATTATSPAIDLIAAAAPQLTFRMWVETEGATYDGANLQVSADGGATYSIVSSVSSPYPLTIGGEPAWGGHQAALGWQLVQADLSAYAGQVISLRFAFRSDPSGNFSGVYVDDVRVTAN